MSASTIQSGFYPEGFVGLAPDPAMCLPFSRTMEFRWRDVVEGEITSSVEDITSRTLDVTTEVIRRTILEQAWKNDAGLIEWIEVPKV